jgi:hypothetical protein
VINALNGAVQIITSKSRYKVAEKAKRIFGKCPVAYLRKKVGYILEKTLKLRFTSSGSFKSVSHPTFPITWRREVQL